jgi:hypothetical protein
MMLSAIVLDWRTQVFSPQLYNCTALKLMSVGEEIEDQLKISITEVSLFVCRTGRSDAREATSIHLLSRVFFQEFCWSPNWLPLVGRCRKSDHHPSEDLAKCGFKPEINY